MIVDDNVLWKNQHGRFDKWIFRVVGGHTVRSRYPDYSDKQWTQKQVASQVKFKDATDYAKMVMANPKLKAKYQKRVIGLQNAWNLAIGDFMRRSRREEVDTSGYEVLRRDLFNNAARSKNVVKNRGRVAARAIELPGSVRDSAFGVKGSAFGVKGSG